MTSLTNGTPSRAPESLTFALARATGQDVNLGRPDLRWRHGRGLISQLLLGGFFLVARPLIAMQKRHEEREKLARLPDYLLKDVGLERSDLGPELDDLIKLN